MMQWQYTPYVPPLLVAAIISAAIALYAWRHRSTPGATPLVLLMLAVIVWSLGYVLELASSDLATKVFWSNVNFLGIVIVPTAWLALVLQYTGREKWLTRRNLALLTIEPLIILLLVWTNDLHHLFRSNAGLDTSGPFPMLDPTYSTGFWVHAVYSYPLLLLGTLLLIQTLVRSPRLYRGQAIVLLVAALAPWVGNVLHISGLSPFPHLDLTPFAFTLTGLALAWGLFRFRLLDIVPVARNAVLESMGDGVIVMDAQNRIVDLNPAAAQIIDRPVSEVIGQPAVQVLSGHLDLVEHYHDAPEAHAEIVLGADEARRYYDLRISPLHDRRGRLTSRLIVLHDVTRRKQAEEASRESEERYIDLYDNAPDMYFTVKRDGTVLSVNYLGAEMLGYQKDELIGKPVTIVFHPDDVALAQRQIDEILKGEGGISKLDFRKIRKDGSVIYVSERISLQHDPQEGPILRIICRDITERKRTEEELRRECNLAEALAEATAALTSTLDFEEVLDRILEQVGRVVSNDAANVMLIEGDHVRIVRWRGYERFGSEEFVSTIVFRISEVPNLQQMVETREPMVIPDTATYPGWVQVPTQKWLRSYASAPIVVRGEVIGFLNVGSATPGFFTQAHVIPLRAFADYAAAAIENARLFEAANQRVAELEAVRQASLSLTSSLELPLVLEAILEHALQLVSADDAHVFLYDDGRLTFGAALWAGGRQQVPYAEPRPDGLTYTVAHSGERIVVSDMNDHPLFQDGQWDGAIAGLPLCVGGQVHGVMNVAYEEPHVFSENELGVLELLADQAAIAIENARLYERVEQSLEQLTALRQTSLDITARLDTTTLLEAIVRRATELLEAKGGGIYLYDPIRQELTVAVDYGLRRSVVGTTLALGEGMSGQVAQTGKPMIVNDYRTWPGRSAKYAKDLFTAVVDVPLRWQGQVIGVLSILGEVEERVFTDNDAQLLGLFADQAAIAIQNAQLYRQVTRRVREQTLLNRISGGFGAALNVDPLINCALEGLRELVGADRTYFVTTDPDACTWETTRELVAPGIEPDIGLSGAFDDVPAELETILSGQPFAVSDIATDPRIEGMRETYRALGMQSMLLMPVQARGRLYGTLGFDFCRERHAWQPDEIRLLEGVAHQLELALENVRLLEEARLRADELATALARQEDLDRLKDEFIQNVSHELRSPLALVCGYAEMLDTGELGELQPEQQRSVAIITRRAHMLSDLVQDITLILETKVNPPEAEPVPLDELALAAVEDFQVVTRQAGLTLQAEIAPHLPPVSGFPIYLRRVLDNLIGNAIKFTPEEGTITVQLRQDGRWVALEVSDTGIGMPADKLERVFERFYQVDGSTKRKYGGVGLGLALVKEIVETCGGSVTVESQVGEGTTFTVLFPISAGTEETE